MSHNKMLLSAYIGAKEVIRQHMMTIGHGRVSELEPGDEILSIRKHWEIYEAIRDRKYRTCKKLLVEMISG